MPRIRELILILWWWQCISARCWCHCIENSGERLMVCSMYGSFRWLLMWRKNSHHVVCEVHTPKTDYSLRPYVGAIAYSSALNKDPVSQGYRERYPWLSQGVNWTLSQGVFNPYRAAIVTSKSPNPNNADLRLWRKKPININRIYRIPSKYSQSQPKKDIHNLTWLEI